MYAKIFAQIHDSSLSEDYLARLVFMDLLILCDEAGVVDITIEAIARRTNVPLDVVRSAIQKLEQPDPQSRSKEEGGRRIVRLDPEREWGWLIVNYVRYRELRTKEDRKEYQRNYFRENRSKWARASQQDSTPLNNSQQAQPSAYTSASVSVSTSTSESEKNKEARSVGKLLSISDLPFAAEPDFAMESPAISDSEAIAKAADYLHEHHDQSRRGRRDDTIRALRGIVAKEPECPVTAIMDRIRRQHARWRQSGGWKRGYVNSLTRWLEEDVWKEDPPRDAEPEQAAPRKLYREGLP